jgi:hypothetical protein
MEPTKFRQFDPGVDYTSLLTTSEIKEEDGRQFVYLRGLERLAKERGIVSAMCVRLDEMKHNKGIICTYQYGFKDGCIYHGSADATPGNCEGDFGAYLTAMAESRAKARALRTAFGISMCSVEEKADVVVIEDAGSTSIEDHQLQAIKFLAKQKELGKDDVLGLLSKPRAVGDMRELTKEEGRELISRLNEQKQKAVKKTARR